MTTMPAKFGTSTASASTTSVSGAMMPGTVPPGAPPTPVLVVLKSGLPIRVGLRRPCSSLPGTKSLTSMARCLHNSSNSNLMDSLMSGTSYSSFRVFNRGTTQGLGGRNTRDSVTLSSTFATKDTHATKRPLS
jgi:hypothetical protein